MDNNFIFSFCDQCHPSHITNNYSFINNIFRRKFILKLSSHSDNQGKVKSFIKIAHYGNNSH